MLKFSALALAAAAALSFPGLAAVAQTAAASPPAITASAPGFDRSGEDRSVRVQDDLFRAANGEWLKTTQIPADKASYGNFDIVGDRADARVREVVEELAKGSYAAGSVEQKISAFYRTFLDVAAMDKAGLAPLQPWLDKVGAVRNGAELVAVMGSLHGLTTLPLALDVQPDQQAPDMNLALAWQSGLGLPNREYYLASDPRMLKARGAYMAYLVKLFTLAGTNETEASRHAALVMGLETRLAKAQWTEVANRDPQKTWNPMTLAALARSAPGMDWAGYFKAAAMPGLVRLNVSQPSYAKELAKAVHEVPLATWKLYLQARLMDSQGNLLGQPWREARFDFRYKALQGRQAEPPRWQQATDALDGALGEAVGQVYVARYFPADHKVRMQQLVNNLLTEFGRSIDGLQWMSATTRQKAREKLGKYTTKIGYPDHWRDYTKLEVRDGDAIGNAARAGRFEHERVAAKLGQPVDRSEWGLTPQTVNAYYNPSLNEVVFPAAILEPPFFDMAADDATNYGAIGAIIGHEISHGFDDQGAQYDGDGRLRNWWTPADSKAFAALGARLAAQYGGYEALPGHKVNGQLTLGENIADLSGLQIAFKAWKLTLKGQPAPVIAGLTGEQRFFYAFAHAWRSQRREELTLRLLTADPHSPDEFRANGTVINQDAFHEAFGTRQGDKLYKPGAERIRIW